MSQPICNCRQGIGNHASWCDAYPEYRKRQDARRAASVGKPTIHVVRRGGGFHASVAGRHGLWALGSTRTQAVGELILEHAAALGLTLTDDA
jgi:hypothetical protein